MNFFHYLLRLSLTWRVTILLTTGMLFFLLLLNISIYWGTSNLVYRYEKQNLHEKTSKIVEEITSESNWKIAFSLDRLRDIMMNYSSKYEAIFVIDKDGNEIISIIGSEFGKESTNHTQDTITAQERFLFPGSTKPYLLKIDADTKPIVPYLQILLLILVSAAITTLIFSSIGSYLLTRLGLHPLSRLVSNIHQMNETHIFTRLPSYAETEEIHDLVIAFNTLMDRLEEVMKRQEQFIADASHEFKTPLAIIEGYVRLLDRWGKDKPDVRDEAITAIKQECTRLFRLIEDLLTLAKSSQADVISDDIVVQSIVPLLKEVQQAWLSVYPKHLTLTITWEEPLVAAVDRNKLRQVLDILLDNARKYTERGEVTLRTYATAAWIHIHVEDTGIGIAEEELPYVFERFYRVEKSRNRFRGGSGLGLPIAKSIVEAHGGKITIHRIKTGGTDVHVQLPRNHVLPKDEP